MKKHVLVFGAGRSSTYLFEYFKKEFAGKQRKLTVADANADVAKAKISGFPEAHAVAIDVQNNALRGALIKDADVVISLLPAALHFLVAQDCLSYRKHLLTASYVD